MNIRKIMKHLGMSCPKWLLWGILPLLILGSCLEKPTVDSDALGVKKPYFDLDSLITAQIDLFDSNKPLVDKVMRINEEEDKLEGVEIVDWEKELQLFRQADINKPTLIELYQTESIKRGTLTGFHYSTADNVPPTKEMEVLFDGMVLQTVSILYQERNALYHSTRSMKLTFGENGQLHAFEIEGFQKLIGQDSLHYAIQAQIN